MTFYSLNESIEQTPATPEYHCKTVLELCTLLKKLKPHLRIEMLPPPYNYLQITSQEGEEMAIIHIGEE